MPPETFDKPAALDRHKEIMREVQRIRDGINIDVLDYYWERVPDTAEEEAEMRGGMRKFLNIAQERIHDLLHGKLD